MGGGKGMAGRETQADGVENLRERRAVAEACTFGEACETHENRVGGVHYVVRADRELKLMAQHCWQV